jgi:hypothetical protein
MARLARTLVHDGPPEERRKGAARRTLPYEKSTTDSGTGQEQTEPANLDTSLQAQEPRLQPEDHELLHAMLGQLHTEMLQARQELMASLLASCSANYQRTEDMLFSHLEQNNA